MLNASSDTTFETKEDNINALSVVIDGSVPNNDINQDNCITDDENVNTTISNSENSRSNNYCKPNLSSEESTVKYSVKTLNGNSELKSYVLKKMETMLLYLRVKIRKMQYCFQIRIPLKKSVKKIYHKYESNVHLACFAQLEIFT